MDHRDHPRAAGALERVERPHSPGGENALPEHWKQERGEEEDREDVAEIDWARIAGARLG
jgi:hypothetical protein